MFPRRLRCSLALQGIGHCYNKWSWWPIEHSHVVESKGVIDADNNHRLGLQNPFYLDHQRLTHLSSLNLVLFISPCPFPNNRLRPTCYCVADAFRHIRPHVPRIFRSIRCLLIVLLIDIRGRVGEDFRFISYAFGCRFAGLRGVILDRVRGGAGKRFSRPCGLSYKVFLGFCGNVGSVFGRFCGVSGGRCCCIYGS